MAGSVKSSYAAAHRFVEGRSGPVNRFQLLVLILMQGVLAASSHYVSRKNDATMRVAGIMPARASGHSTSSASLRICTFRGKK